MNVIRTTTTRTTVRVETETVSTPAKTSTMEFVREILKATEGKKSFFSSARSVTRTKTVGELGDIAAALAYALSTHREPAHDGRTWADVAANPYQYSATRAKQATK